MDKKKIDILSTEELESIIKSTSDINSALEKYSESMSDTQSSECVKLIVAKSGKVNSEILKEINLSTSYYYEIINGKKAPSRDVFLQFLLITKTKIDIAQEYLKECGYRQLYPRNRRDAILIYALSNEKTLIETNILLDSLDLPPLH